MKEIKKGEETIELTDKAHKELQKHDLDPTVLSGTGKDGRIVVGDVRTAVKDLEEGNEHFDVGRWNGLDNYECSTSGCRFSTLDKNRILEHSYNCNEPIEESEDENDES